MTLSRRAREMILVAGLIVLPGLVLRASVRAPDRLSPLDRALLRLTAPLQTGLMWLLDGTRELFSRYVALVNTERDNARLRRENQELRAQLLSLSLLKSRGERLERLLELRNELVAETAAARVVGVETSPQFRVVRVRLDRGGSEVRPGMPVLAPAGVVGRIARTVGPYSDVLLLVDPRSSIDVLLPRTGSRGVLKGSPGADRYRCRVEYVARQDEVQVGDLVVTSGLGGLFPRDLPVGKVVRIEKKAYGLYQDVEVEPAVDFGKLREVLIVLAPPPPPDPDAGRRAPEGARGLVVPR
ncbi:MAG: rod shape-determining protein MreC [Myxococcales bacterium]|nr:rod shape-determining protein MreC [Myxococcales bacterium]